MPAMMTSTFLDLGLAPAPTGLPGAPPPVVAGAAVPDFAAALTGLMAGTAPAALAQGVSANRQVVAAPGKPLPVVLPFAAPTPLSTTAPVLVQAWSDLPDCEMPDPASLPSIAAPLEPEGGPAVDIDQAADPTDPPLDPALVWLMPPVVAPISMPIKAAPGMVAPPPPSIATTVAVPTAASPVRADTPPTDPAPSVAPVKLAPAGAQPVTPSIGQALGNKLTKLAAPAPLEPKPVDRPADPASATPRPLDLWAGPGGCEMPADLPEPVEPPVAGPKVAVSPAAGPVRPIAVELTMPAVMPVMSPPFDATVIDPNVGAGPIATASMTGGATVARPVPMADVRVRPVSVATTRPVSPPAPVPIGAGAIDAGADPASRVAVGSARDPIAPQPALSAASVTAPPPIPADSPATPTLVSPIIAGTASPGSTAGSPSPAATTPTTGVEAAPDTKATVRTTRRQPLADVADIRLRSGAAPRLEIRPLTAPPRDFGATLAAAAAIRATPAITADLTQDATSAPVSLGTGQLAPTAAGAPVAQPVGSAQQAGIDLTQDHGMHRMIDRIEHLRDAFDTRETRIRLIPDALGPVDISVRRDAASDTVQVHFTAAEAGTRQLIADAQQRLVEIADTRGVRIERATVDGGATGGQQGWSGSDQPRPQQQTAQPPRTPARAARDADPQSPEERLA